MLLTDGSQKVGIPFLVSGWTALALAYPEPSSLPD